MTYPRPHREGGRLSRAPLVLLPLLLLLLASPAAATVHTVRRGDSLSRIAKKYRVSVEAIREANTLPGDDLRPGTRLVIPPPGGEGAAAGGGKEGNAGGGAEKGPAAVPSAPSRPGAPKAATAAEGPSGGGEGSRASAGAAPPRRHTVRKGDSLARIAKKYRVSVEELREANGLSSDDLKAGSRLVVPSRAGGRKGADDGAAAPAAPSRGGAPKAAAAEGSSGGGEGSRASAGAAPPRRHTVRKGDSLARIAKKYRVSVEELREANGLSSDDLKAGSRLVVPSRAEGSRGAPEGGAVAKADGKPPAGAAPPARHTVRKGDTLASIAREHRVSVQELRRMNGLGKGARLRPGTELVVSRADRGGRRRPDPEELDRKMRSVAAATGPGEEMAGAVPLRKEEARDGSRPAGPPEEVAISAAPPAAAGASASPGDGEPPSEGWDLTGKVLALAKSMLDVPYRFGGSSFGGIDCSGYVQKVFGYLDIPLPRSAREQFQRGERIEREQLARGDLVFFQTYARFPSHVGIYLGDNQFIHASSRDRRVRIDSLDAPYYVKRYIGARRMLDPLPGGVPSLESATEPFPGEVPERKREPGDDGGP